NGTPQELRQLAEKTKRERDRDASQIAKKSEEALEASREVQRAIKAQRASDALNGAKQATRVGPWVAESWIALGDARAVTGDVAGAVAADARAATIQKDPNQLPHPNRVTAPAPLR